MDGKTDVRVHIKCKDSSASVTNNWHADEKGFKGLLNRIYSMFNRCVLHKLMPFVKVNRLVDRVLL